MHMATKFDTESKTQIVCLFEFVPSRVANCKLQTAA
jgi:hypothetical protein